MNESDERYSTAEEAIYEAFFLLLKEKDLDRITVSDVIKKAGIVRSTFYNHYENIPALVNAAEDKTINDIFKLMESFNAKNDREMCRSYYLAICNYTRKNPFLANLLQSPRGDAFFEKAITMFHRYVSEVTPSNIVTLKSQAAFSYMIAGAIGSTIGILHKWTAEDFKTPAETIADLLSQIFVSGILPYLTTGN
ncbi:MAG: TetR/AcrR family transcriptional regulator [Lachnospiraceae bacterium]|nr:TetR/AcrR family transcriptional regulator [Lachnospiraceae bacterium]